MVHLFTVNEHGDDVCECRVMLDTSSCTVTFPGEEPVHLTDMEARIVLELIKAKGMPVSKERIIDRVWGGYASNDTLAHRIASIRRKVGNGRVLTVYGHGYRLSL